MVGLNFGCMVLLPQVILEPNIPFLVCLQITRSDIRPHVSLVSLMIADGYLIFLSGLRGYVQINILN